MTTAAVGVPIITNHEETRKAMREYYAKRIGWKSVRKYAGKHVIIRNRKVVASGNSPDEVVEEAKKKNLLPVLVTFIPK